ncbi:hypothetical protein DFP72DRAFT_864996 [Ephemerocybe angulata]|uniref:Uncharacterized protein n=1 Tax=Ephemerocybe angulata TaxID=980116 RepID=A0A8H6IHV5_9AGAR|nr:hypothetical protein DFP72DRAFT_864996 [Tulosesus angulatus]
MPALNSDGMNNINNPRSSTPPNLFTSAGAEERSDIWRQEDGVGTSSQVKSEGLLPAFSSTQYTHLPTPQSPSDSNRLVPNSHFAFESPLPSSQSSQSFNAAAGSLGQRFSQRSLVDEGSSRPPQIHQILTPDSSPHVSRVAAPQRQSSFATPTYHSSHAPVPQAGGEMERIRQAAREEQLSHQREAEARRPDYLKRMKPDASNGTAEDERAVGIMETPARGRRLKLFQETSEESFEESLMAGGYGRYRTADWVRQPQPLSFPAAGLPGAANIVQRLETIEEQKPPPPPTEKELKKRKRLEAFRSSRSEPATRTKLYAVELEGKGRSQAVLNLLRRKEASKRKKKPETPDEPSDRPNWPDAEFPWRLRTEELAGRSRLLGTKMKTTRRQGVDPESEAEETRSENQGPLYRPGRGKNVPLLAYPGEPSKAEGKKRRYTYLPTDPSDARSALFAKRSVRALSYRKERREREDKEELEELCICRGTDDGRKLVQCDWCIGIRSVAELGPEEAPWFCRPCCELAEEVEERMAVDEPMSEPTFVPTDEAPRERSSDATLNLHQTQSWPDFFKSFAPTTPKGHGQPVRAHAQNTTPNAKSPFDPTSTPSRGIRFAGPFSTPKVNVFSGRPGPLFNTPSRPGHKVANRGSFGGPGTLSAALDDGGRGGARRVGAGSPLLMGRVLEDSPVMRTKGKERAVNVAIVK